MKISWATEVELRGRANVETADPSLHVKGD